MDFISHPIIVTNAGRNGAVGVAIHLTNECQLISEIARAFFSGAFNADIAPINPRTKVDGVGGVRISLFRSRQTAAGGRLVYRANKYSGSNRADLIARSIMQSG